VNITSLRHKRALASYYEELSRKLFACPYDVPKKVRREAFLYVGIASLLRQFS